MTHPSAQAGVPVYTFGWGSLAPFPVSERGLGIYLFGWFGGQPDTSNYPDEVAFPGCDIVREQILQASIQTEVVQQASINQESILQADLARESVHSATIAREQVTPEVER